MPKARKNRGGEGLPEKLQGWKAISEYLGVRRATAEHWAKTGMLVRREGRYTVANTDELRRWLGREAHMPGPAYVLTEVPDISSALKESIAAARKQKRRH
jgi:hypothetical protein